MSEHTYKPVNVRLTPAMMEQLDALLTRLDGVPELATTVKITRSDVLRLCVLRGIKALEEELTDQGLAQVAEDRMKSPEWVTEAEVIRRLGL